MTNRDVSNIGKCEDLCDNHDTCKSVDYHPYAKECILNNADSSTVLISSPCSGHEYSERVNS